MVDNPHIHCPSLTVNAHSAKITQPCSREDTSMDLDRSYMGQYAFFPSCRLSEAICTCDSDQEWAGCPWPAEFRVSSQTFKPTSDWSWIQLLYTVFFQLITCYCTLPLNTRSFPTFSLHSALDVHLSPVTSVQYCSKCPEEFIASLQSVNSKLIAENKSTKVYMFMYLSFIFVNLFVKRANDSQFLFLFIAMATERWKVGWGGIPNVHRPHHHWVSFVWMCCDLAVHHWVSFVHIHAMVMTVITAHTRY